MSKDGNFSRKGPVINGVRRTLVTSPQHVIQPNHDSEANKTGNLKTKPIKSLTGMNFVAFRFCFILLV